ncbi:MAG: anaerobic sulfatase maturase [Clostridia bacterium]|nr:anaerobic sulfatase maturase [Clostridia bacterium]
MPPVSVLIKPASGSCNMRCNYCFYADEMHNRSVAVRGVMDDATTENIIKKALSYATHTCDFGFQGGEPTLAGLDYFARFAELCDKYNVNGVKLSYALQTNGLVIDGEWAKFFKKRNFLIGLSLDGPRDINDYNRLDAGGVSVFARVMRAAEALRADNVDFNILTVVTKQTARHIQKVYSFLTKNGFAYQQYIPCLDPFTQQRGSMPYSLTPAEYGKFLRSLFDMWVADRKKGKYVYIRYFENLAGMLQGHEPESCDMCGHCLSQYVVESDGSVYPCDFYMLDDWLIGNLNSDSFEQLENNPRRMEFINASLKPHEDCASCSVRSSCRGGCRRHRQENLTSEIGKNYFCEAYKSFLSYALPIMANAIRP